MSDVTVVLEGLPTWSRERRIGHYGGALDKLDSSTEGRQPYAWAFYREFRAARGSAYRTVYEGTKSGLVHSENIASARSEAARWRSADKLANNALPLTSDERLSSWTQILAVETYPDDTRHDLRLRCAAKYQAAVGPIARLVDESVERLLDTTFVRTWRLEGTDLATPPTPTFWPGINPGPAAYSLGGGAWLSARSHFVVEVEQPAGMNTSQFLQLMNVHLFRLLDQTLPAWATFNWATGITGGGFFLDISKLDFTGLI